MPCLLSEGVNPVPERFQLHFQEDGSFLVRKESDPVEKRFESLSEALQYVHALGDAFNARLKVYDTNGREIAALEE